MPITKKRGRQNLLVAEIDFTFSDIAPTATISEAINLPAGAVVVGGDLVITTPWNTTGTATLNVGDGGSASRYASGVNLKSAARTALTLTGFKYTVKDSIDVVPTLADAAATAGAATLRVFYTLDGRVNENQP